MENGSAIGPIAISPFRKIARGSELYKTPSFGMLQPLTQQSNHLRSHLLPVHCSWPGCSHRAAWQKCMRRHYETHRSRRTFQCLLCDEWFTRKCNLRRHEKESHGGKKRARKVDVAT